ncbi:hypothetical protein BCV69DRAFT_282720 [Microstroma glucosiphilum]|uniref:Uncharacterized protein n=1 Tax=Pseudomicrostroma glucosiphilum TaxID=1684307 RepID=A0A316U7L9_9BASI|nr:hypothetical protein BCV69DRAFT_282720 [Pseudomicrostroma glucosiphilum]PWN21229.1 hypothetical protein BCV69DRAFT_282720 [Pseudomicrostroma glucosiphilum]
MRDYWRREAARIRRDYHWTRDEAERQRGQAHVAREEAESYRRQRDEAYAFIEEHRDAASRFLFVQHERLPGPGLPRSDGPFSPLRSPFGGPHRTHRRTPADRPWASSPPGFPSSITRQWDRTRSQ